MDTITAIHQTGWKWDQAARFFDYKPGHGKEVERRYKPHLLAMLRAAGFNSLQVGVCGANDPIDLVVNGYGIEVKVSRNQRKRRRDQYYKALLKHTANNHHLNGDFVLLLCVVMPGPEFCAFVIPRAAIGDRCTIEITSDPWQYQGQWAQYRNRWDLLKGGSRAKTSMGSGY